MPLHDAGAVRTSAGKESAVAARAGAITVGRRDRPSRKKEIPT
jgi:hypothetical protein